MSLESISVGPLQQSHTSNALPPNAKSKELDKTTQLFKKSVSAEAQREEENRNEREYFVNDIMKRKGVTHEVAEAEYDFF